MIGLEVHAQIKSKSKVFCEDSVEFGKKENSQISPVSLALPGTLPVPNKKVIGLAVCAGLAFHCKIATRSIFARKNYFYPDLPKGYQISQDKEPLCREGFVEFFHEGELRKVGIERCHVEEDAGKSLHYEGKALINFNRAGVGLLEIVSRPELRSPREATEYAKAVRRILRYLEVCDGNLEQGSMRCDCNVSVAPSGADLPGVRVELKNINSFKFIEKGLQFEIERQISLLEKGKKVSSETRLFDPKSGTTKTMRKKEEAYDYRYFPEPDIPPLVLEEKWISSLKKTLPELPLEKAHRYRKDLKIPSNDSFALADDRRIAEFFEEVAELSKNSLSSSRWIMGDVLRKINEEKIPFEQIPLTPKSLAQIIALIDEGKISGKIGKIVFEKVWEDKTKTPEEVVMSQGLLQISDEKEIEKIVQEVLKENPNQLEKYREGKTKLFGFFAGEVMKKTQGRAHPEKLNKILKKKLG